MNPSEAVKPNTKMHTSAILAILVFSAFLGLFNETILNVALNILMQEMNVTAGTVQWIITSYMIIVAVMVPVTAFFIQSFEIKKLYLSAMAILLAGTIGCAFSASFAVLLVSRMIQAVGAGMMVSIMMTIVLTITPPEKHGSAMGLCACAIQLGPALGPTVSGLILQFFDWHVLFISLIPIVILLMIFGYLYLANVINLTKPKIDIISILLSSIGVGGVVYGLNGFSGGGSLSISIAVFAIGMIALVMFGKRQLSLKEPMLEIRTFRYPLFSIGAALVMISMMTIFTMNVMLPMFLQGALGAATFVSAILLLPATLTNGCMSLISSKIYDKIGVKILLPAGYVILFLSILLLSGSDPGTPLPVIMIIYIAVCIGIGCTLTSSQTSALNLLPREFYPHGVSIINTLQQIAAAIGSALFISIMSATQQNALRDNIAPENAVAAGFHSALWVMLIFIAVGFVLSLTLSLARSKTTASDHAAH